MIKTAFIFVLICFSSIGLAKKVKVGIAVDNISTDRWAVEIKTIENNIRGKGGIVFVKTALGSISHQEEQVNEFLNTQKIDVLILVPVDKNKSANLVTAAQKKGVKVILYSRNVEGVKADAFISFNPYEIGITQAKYVVKNYPKSNVILLGGPTKDFNSKDIEQGQLSVFDSSSVKVVASSHVAAWNKKQAYNEIQKLDSSTSEPIDIVIAGNDILAENVIKYYKEQNKTVKVIGLDADLRACQRIANNNQDMSIYLDIKKAAYCAALVAVELGSNHHLNVETNDIHHKKINGVHTYFINSVVISTNNLLDVMSRLNLYSKQQLFQK